MLQFSVIIPLYNKEDTVRNTITSVLAQSNPNFEIIIVNDGSTDNSLKSVEALNDPRISITSTPNRGVAIARNEGVKQAQNKHIAFLDADDYWYPNHLKTLAHLITKYKNYNWFATGYEIEHNSKLVIPIKSPIGTKGSNWSGIINNYFENSMVDALAWTSVVCMKKSFFVQLGQFDKNLKNGQDTDLWIRAALQSPLVYTNTITARYQYDCTNHISKRNIKDKSIIDFNKYEALAPNDDSLKKYLDYNRYAVAVRYKAEGDIDNYKKHVKNIKRDNLSKKQNLLLKLPPIVIRILFTLKKRMEIKGFRTRTS